jgi:hypothetical protein
MKVSTKDRLQHVLITAAMVTPPWNIFWWTVGLIAYHASGGRKWDTSGDGAIGMVLGAPVTLPSLPFMWAKEKLEERRRLKQERHIRKAAEWIVERLRQWGIVVTKADATSFGLTLVAEVLPEQVLAYQETMAEAIHTFPDVLPEAIRGWGVQPLEHLGSAWAAEYEHKEYAEELFTGPCADCGVRESMGWRFGRQEIEFLRNHEANLRHRISLKDGTVRTVDGHICRTCLDKMGWVSMSSGGR